MYAQSDKGHASERNETQKHSSLCAYTKMSSSDTNGCGCMRMFAEARLQRVPVIIALASAHREVTALDNVLVKMPESAEGIG